MKKSSKKVKMSKIFLNQEEMTSEEAFHRVMRLETEEGQKHSNKTYKKKKIKVKKLKK